MVSKHSILTKESMDFSNGGDSVRGSELRSVRGGEARDDSEQIKNLKSTPESPLHQPYFENSRFNETENSKSKKY